MQFGLAFDISDEILNQLHFFTELNEWLRHKFLDREYGSGVDEVVVGVRLMSIRSSNEIMLPEPTYIKGKEEVEKDGFVLEFERLLEFWIKPSWDSALSANSRKEIAGSFEIPLNLISGKLKAMSIPDFDVSSFLSDLTAFMREWGLEKGPGQISDALPGGGNGVRDIS